MLTSSKNTFGAFLWFLLHGILLRKKLSSQQSEKTESAQICDAEVNLMNIIGRSVKETVMTVCHMRRMGNKMILSKLT